jgi:hypothetical protein
VVRFDRDGDCHEVSIYLDPTLHGLGLGAPCSARPRPNSRRGWRARDDRRRDTPGKCRVAAAVRSCGLHRAGTRFMRKLKPLGKMD